MRINKAVLFLGILLISSWYATGLLTPRPGGNQTRPPHRPQIPGGGNWTPPPTDPGSVEEENVTYLVRESFLLRNELNSSLNDFIYLPMPQNSSHQHAVMVESTLPVSSIQQDEEGNPFALYEYRFDPGESIWLNVTFRVTVETYKIHYNYAAARWPPADVVERYTGKTMFWDVDNETVRRLARSVVDGEDNPVRIAERVAEWITERVNYEVGPRKGVDRAIKKIDGIPQIEGDCNEVADTFVTMMRISGVPARTVFGFLLENREHQVYWLNLSLEDNESQEVVSHWGGHTWPQVYIPPWGWIDVEMLEYLQPKVGDYSWRHILYSVEERKFRGSTIADYCIPGYSELIYMRFEFSSGEGG